MFKDIRTFGEVTEDEVQKRLGMGKTEAEKIARKKMEASGCVNPDINLTYFTAVCEILFPKGQ